MASSCSGRKPTEAVRAAKRGFQPLSSFPGWCIWQGFHVWRGPRMRPKQRQLSYLADFKAPKSFNELEERFHISAFHSVFFVQSPPSWDHPLLNNRPFLAFPSTWMALPSARRSPAWPAYPGRTGIQGWNSSSSGTGQLIFLGKESPTQ